MRQSKKRELKNKLDANYMEALNIILGGRGDDFLRRSGWSEEKLQEAAEKRERRLLILKDQRIKLKEALA